MKYTLFLLSASVWAVVFWALLNAGLAKQFEPECDCDGSKAMATVCKGN
jgi:hypothetical protein